MFLNPLDLGSESARFETSASQICRAGGIGRLLIDLIDLHLRV
jgi:hypothetical protein